MRVTIILASLVGCGLMAQGVRGTDLTPAQRGEKALLGQSFVPPTIWLSAYKNAWRLWGVQETPADYDAAIRERYGLHPAPYPNDGYPMGLRVASGLLGKGLSNDCLICHGGSIMGKSYIGLGNTSLDLQAITEELTFEGRRVKLPFTFSHVRGTNEAGASAVYLLGLRDPDLKLRSQRLDLELHDNLCEDVPAWWLLKKKKSMYFTGGASARSVRSMMQFMMSPLNTPAAIEQAEPAFRDIQAFILSLEPPKYPLAIDQRLARRGESVFKDTCSRCHGIYGDNWTYPNKIVPLDVIGTDRTRFDGISMKVGDYYNQTWFAHEKPDGYKAIPTDGYQAPPLDGIWATAPYLHNGSVPTIYNLLNSKTRPKIFTRSYRTDADAYDRVKVGWKVQGLDAPADPKLPAIEHRKVYDTAQPGRGNAGHTFGDQLSEEERMAVIEYLKTL